MINGGVEVILHAFLTSELDEGRRNLMKSRESGTGFISDLTASCPRFGVALKVALA
jgi:hypothetical protein